MILTSVIVLAIVGSAFEIKAKGGAFCVTANALSFDCTTYLQNKQIGGTGTAYVYAPFWDGNKTTCTASKNGKCSSAGILQFIND